MATRSLFFLCSLFILAQAATKPAKPADPFVDPKDDLYNPLRWFATRHDRIDIV